MKPKKFRLRADEIEELIPHMGGCVASDKIVVEGMKVGYMYRSVPDGACHSGWTFMSGTESQEYTDDADNWALYEVNTIANYDQDIIPHLNVPYKSAFSRNPDTDEFIEEEYQEPEE
jgi:hypothetical protein